LFGKFIGALILSALLFSCATPPPPSSPSTQSYYQIEMAYHFYSNEQRINVDPARKNGLQFLFPIIPGKIFGTPINKYAAITPVTKEGSFLFRVPENMDKEAQQVPPSVINKGVNIQPIDTKILRLGTFHYLNTYGNRLGGGGFAIKNKKQFLILVYFSKPAEITGTISLPQNNETTIHNISVNSKGWHWLVSEEISPNTFKLEKYNGDTNTIEFLAFSKSIST
jgi:hypothetical protein